MADLLSLPEVEVVVDLTILLDPLITLVMLVVQAVELAESSSGAGKVLLIPPGQG